MGSPDDPAPLVTLLNDVRDVPDSIPDVQEVETLSGAQDALGPDAVPILSVSRDDLARLDRGTEAAKLLPYVNGVSSLETICATASITAEEGAAIFLDLAELGVIDFR